MSDVETIKLELPEGFEATEIRLMLKPKTRTKTKVNIQKKTQTPGLDILARYEELLTEENKSL